MGKNVLIFAIVFLLPLVSAVVIEDTVFFSSLTNYTVQVDRVVLDEARVTNISIELENVTSLGSNFTNINSTFDAVVNFIRLNDGFSILNLNTTDFLFTSQGGNNDFNATFTSGQVIQLLIKQFNCSSGVKSILTVLQIFLALALLIFVLMLIFKKGELLPNVTANQIIVVFVGIMIFIVFIGVVADSIKGICG